jgi:hypothetical protein
MEKFIEIDLGNQIDRYRLTDISVNDFIDCFLSGKVSIDKIKDISKDDYLKHIFYALEFNVDDQFTAEHYTLKFPSEESRKDWIDYVRGLRKFESLQRGN